MNNKGFSLIEVILSLAIVSFFAMLLIGMPTSLISEYKDYSNVSQVVTEESTLRSALTKDLSALSVELEGEALTIGKDRVYRFKHDGVYRQKGLQSELKLTSSPYNVSLSNNILTVFNDKSVLEYNVNSSFNKQISKEVQNER